MKAVVFRKYGGVECLTLEEVEIPRIRDDEVLVKNRASSVNPLDWKILKGQLRVITGLSRPRIRTLGFDVCGEVVETGNEVKFFREGDRIYARTTIRGGAFAEYSAIPERIAARAPLTLSDAEAASVPLASLTALQALRDRGRLQEGQKVLINGGSGGVGTFAVQIAKVFGSEVTAVCSGDNAGFVQLLGACSIIDYTKEDFTQSNDVYDIVFDIVANRSFSECRRILAPRGVYVTTVPSLADIPSMLVTLLRGRKRATFINVKSSRADLDWMSAMIDQDMITPIINKEYPLSQVADALTYSEAGHAKGKIVIKIE